MLKCLRVPSAGFLITENVAGMPKEAVLALVIYRQQMVTTAIIKSHLRRMEDWRMPRCLCSL